MSGATRGWRLPHCAPQPLRVRRGTGRGVPKLCGPPGGAGPALAALWRLREEGGWDLAQAGRSLGLGAGRLALKIQVGIIMGGGRSYLISNRVITLGHLQTLDIPGPHCPAVSSWDRVLPSKGRAYPHCPWQGWRRGARMAFPSSPRHTRLLGCGLQQQASEFRDDVREVEGQGHGGILLLPVRPALWLLVGG